MPTAVPWIDPPLPPLEPPPVTSGGRSQSTIRLILLAVVIGVAVQLCGPLWIQALFSAVRLESYRELMACVAAFIASIALHEAGHLLAAILLKFEVLGGSLGPFRVSRFHGEWSFQFSTRTLFSGSVSAIPRRRAPWRKSMMIVVAAGPFSTLLTGAASAWALSYWPASTLPGEFFGLLAQLSFFLFTLGLIPSGANAPARNDSDLFLSILRRTPSAENILLYHAVMEARIEGFRPRYYPEELIRGIAAANCGPDMRLLFAQTISAWALDRGDLETAHAWNRRAVELSADCAMRLRNHALAESACLDIALREDRSSAETKLAEVNFDILSPLWFLHRTRAIRALTLGNISETLGEVCRAEYHFPNCMPYYDHQRIILACIRRAAKGLSRRKIRLHAAPAQHG